MSTKVKEDLIKSANLIRQKYRALKRGKFIDEEQRLESLKPLTEPLQKLVENKENNETAVVVPTITRYPITPTRIRPPITNRVSTPTKHFHKKATKYLSNYATPDSSKLTDTTYGLRKDEKEFKFYIGDSRVEIQPNDDIEIKDKVYKGTEGLWSLLTLKEPDLKNVVTQEDLNNYREIILATNAHKRNYRPDEQLAGNSGKKYSKVIKPLLQSGTGIKEVTGNKIDYVYWNDPNELVDRLRLLILSKEAGNSGLDNEIESILEELREANIII